jgi:hypothetical protein
MDTYKLYSSLEKKFLFLGISSTNIDTLGSLHYQCVETWNIGLLSQPLTHLLFKFFVISETFTTQL